MLQVVGVLALLLAVCVICFLLLQAVSGCCCFVLVCLQPVISQSIVKYSLCSVKAGGWDALCTSGLRGVGCEILRKNGGLCWVLSLLYPQQG